MQVLEQTEVEEVEDDSGSFSVSLDPDVGVEGGAELQAFLGDLADSFDVSGFKCAKCGLVHEHDTTKHRASDSFDMSDKEAASMEYLSTCHCGVQELGRRGSEYGVDEGQAASTAANAPIPDHAAREMNDKFGGL